ncbi:Peptidase M20 [Carpediemonas membranifera]|uniref:Peptidase M20 n=1 Tax=Carpediemonas membranifera TaxID=201153 RepID=A0A8J6B0R2_9EUKA|nr:Peptidase M20 [Carpediemonas membranifera]|eukprot:KAG9395940.1 Peptidase M20 [Carpediemonas membranifera]
MATNNNLLTSLPPCGTVWERFFDVCAIPHGSGNVETISKWIIDFATKNGLEAKQDSAKNVLVTKAADSGCENKPTILLQCHMDMVCESNDASFDFATRGIECEIAELNGKKILTAKGTTLGADDGIGIAAGLALLTDKDLKSGKLELLCTVDEETTMAGAEGIDAGFFTAKYLVNIDSEDEGVVTLGSAGGFDVSASTKVALVETTDTALELSLSGCVGGHSGVEIHQPRANAVVALFDVLKTLLMIPGVRLASFAGGKATNAIPRSAKAVITAPTASHPAIREACDRALAGLKANHPMDVDMALTMTLADATVKTTSLDDSARIIGGTLAMPCGVIRMDGAIEGLVQTSCNVGNVSLTEEGDFKCEMFARSSVNDSMDLVHNMVKATGLIYGLDVSEQEGRFSGWKPNPDTKIAHVTIDAVKKVLGYEPKEEAIHAGLECGLLMDKYHDLEAVSIGATICQPHCPDEYMEIDTVAPFYEILKVICTEME